MDISTIKPIQKHLEIKHPLTGENIGVIITLVDLDDEKLKRVRRNILDRRLHLEQRGKYFKQDEIDENRISLAYTAIVDWEWLDDANYNGKKPELTLENATEIFKALPWFRQQIEEFLGDEKNFY